jgi:transcriptional regulator of NAD metabolism
MSVFESLSSEKRTLFYILNSQQGITAKRLEEPVRCQSNTIIKNICHLRKKGVPIKSTMIQVARDTKIAVYWIDKSESDGIRERFGI